MSVWKSIGGVLVSVGKVIYDQLKENAEEIKKYKSRYQGVDEEELIRIIKNGVGVKRVAAYSVLKSRGWEPDDIDTIMDLERDLERFEKMSK